MIEINQILNAQLVPIALSDKTEIVKLDLYSDDVDQGATIVDNYRPNNKILKSFIVPAFNYNDLIQKLKIENISIVKIDVEGAENEVLKSFSQIMQLQKPYIICEILPAYSEENIFRIQRQKEIEVFLEKQNYIIYRFNQLLIEKMITFEIHANMNLTNYIFVHKEKETDLLKFFN